MASRNTTRRATRQPTDKINISNTAHSKSHEWDEGKDIHVREIQRLIGASGHIALKDEDTGTLFKTVSGGLIFRGIKPGWYVVVPQPADYKASETNCFCAIL
jgi:hypothetical protein